MRNTYSVFYRVMDSPIVADMPPPVPPLPDLDSLARERIKQWLASTGITQTALAEQIGKDQAWTSRYLAGFVVADLMTLQRLAAVFGQSLTALLSIPATDPIEARVIDAYRALTPKRRTFVLELLEDWNRADRRGRTRRRRE